MEKAFAPHARRSPLVVWMAVLVCVAWPAAGAADILPTPRWRVVPNGDVRAAVEKEGSVYVAGGFTHVFQPPPADPLFVDRTTGSPLTGCASKTGRFDLVPDAAGGAFVRLDLNVPDTFWDGSGPFAPPAGTTFLRILPSCRWDRGFLPERISPGGAPGVGLFFDTGTVVLGTNRGVTSASLAAYDRITGQRLVSITSWPVVAIEPLGMAGPDTVVVMTVENPPSVTYSLRHLTVSTMALSGQVPLPRQPGLWLTAGRVFVQPNFTPEGNPWPGPRPLYSLDPVTLQPSAGWTNPTEVGIPYVAGGYLFGLGPSGLVRRHLATGELDTTWAARPGLTPFGVDGSRLLVGNGTGYEALDSQTGAPTGWSANVYQALVTVMGQAVSLGRVAGVNGVYRPGLVAVNATTGALLPFDPLVSLPRTWAYALAANSRHLYVTVSGSLPSAMTVLRIDRATGVIDPAWAPIFDTGGPTPVRDVPEVLVATDTTLYLGGEFRRVGGATGAGSLPMTARLGAAAIDLATGNITPWNPMVESVTYDNVRGMALANDSLYLAGAFSSVGGHARAGFARVDLVTGAPLGPVLPVALNLWSVASDGSNAYVAAAQGLGAATLARITPAGAVTTAAATGLSLPGPVVAGQRVYLDRERDAVTLEPTASPVRSPFAFAGENGVMALVTSGSPADFGLYYYGFAVAAPPGAPQGLTVQTDGNAVRLSWSPAAADPAAGADLGAPASYVVRAGSGTGLFNIADVDTGSLATSLATTAPNGTYFVRVHARNAFGSSPASNEVTFTLGPPVCTTPPGAPGTLSATVSGVQVAFSWGSAASAGTYVLEAGTATGLSNLAAINIGAGLTFAASAAPGTYFARVRGSNACGVGPASNEVELTLGSSVPLPGAPRDLSASVSGRTVTLAWSAPGSGGAPSGYVLEAGSAQGLVNIAVTPVSTTGFVATNVPPGTYFVRVRATNAGGTGPPTTDVVVDVP